MRALQLALVWGGPLLVAAAWVLVRRRGVSVWIAMGATLGPLGLAATLSGRPRVGAELSTGAAAGAGVGAGVALYVATAAFMFVASRWPALARQTDTLYDQRRGVPLAAALAIAVLVVAPGEEIFWRGLVQPLLEGPLGALGAASAAWGVYVAANAVSGSLPIVLGAAVGGAAWAALALWTGGALASVLSHMVWTGMMIVLPPVPRR